jgi:hypothetical protein
MLSLHAVETTQHRYGPKTKEPDQGTFIHDAREPCPVMNLFASEAPAPLLLFTVRMTL